MKNIISSIVILLILGYVIYCEVFRSYTEYEVHVSYEYIDTVIYRDSLIPYKVEVPKEIDIKVFDTIWQKDTIYIKEFITELFIDYNTKRFYSDTLDLDTLGIITANSIVHKNRLESINFGIGLTVPKYTTSIVDRNWGVGVIGGYKSFSPTVVYTKPKFHYIGSYNLIRNEVQGGLIYRF